MGGGYGGYGGGYGRYGGGGRGKNMNPGGGSGGTNYHGFNKPSMGFNMIGPYGGANFKGYDGNFDNFVPTPVSGNYNPNYMGFGFNNDIKFDIMDHKNVLDDNKFDFGSKKDIVKPNINNMNNLNLPTNNK